jgi:hypothetical protein
MLLGGSGCCKQKDNSSAAAAETECKSMSQQLKPNTSALALRDTSVVGWPWMLHAGAQQQSRSRAQGHPVSRAEHVTGAVQSMSQEPCRACHRSRAEHVTEAVQSMSQKPCRACHRSRAEHVTEAVQTRYGSKQDRQITCWAITQKHASYRL